MNDDATISPAAVFAALLRRDLTVMRRELPSFLLRTTLQPLLFVTIFGYVLPKMGMVARGYSAAMLPGIIALSLALAAVQAVVLPLAMDFGYSKEIEDRLLAPAPIPMIAVEKIVAGIVQGVIAALFVLPIARLIMGPIPGLTFANFGVLVGITLLGGAAFSCLGLYLGTAIAPQQIGLMFSVIVTPLIMFGCAYYPWRGLDAIPVMKYAVLINPLVYVAEGMRAALTPVVPHMSLAAIVVALIALTSLLLWLGLRSFMKRALS
jgi:ABC-2 type transport system permease protein